MHGILLLNKPVGISSNGALGRSKYIFQTKKAGHTGSLDPIATGMLPICFGEATKYSRFLLDANKTYLVTAKLGVQTTTGDTEGEILRERSVSGIVISDIKKALNQFLGKQSQVPPMFSALKHQGQPLYKLARQGIVIERAPREIEITSITLKDHRLDDTESWVQFSVSCSKGTYIRSLVEDLGEVLGCGGHVTGLHRESVAGFQAHEMYSLETLQDMGDAGTLQQALLPIDAGLSGWPEIAVSSSCYFFLRQGQSVKVPGNMTDEAMDWIRIKSQDGQFLGMGQMLDNGHLAPRRLLQSAGL